MEFELKDCLEQTHFICQTQQTPDQNKVEIMRLPDFVLPLDNITETAEEFRVGFSDSPVFETELLRPAFFYGKTNSNIKVQDISSISTEHGISIGMWIRPFEKSGHKGLLDITISIEPFQYLLFNLLVNGQLQVAYDIDGSTPDTKTLLKSHMTHISNGDWTFVGFTYNPKTKSGAFFANASYGYGIGNSNHEGKFFDISNNDWFVESKNEAKSMTIGINNGGWNFFGEISCLQIFNKYLSPALMQKVSKTCHVTETYTRAKPCPLGYMLMNNTCFKFMMDAKTYAEAEVSCTSDPNDPFEGRLAFPDNFQVLENLAYIAKEKLGVDIFVGLDALTGIFFILQKIIFYYYFKY